MTNALRIAVNCVFAAAAAYGALRLMGWADALLMARGWDATFFFSTHLPQGADRFAVWLYDVLRFACFGVLAATLMLFLRPRQRVLYAVSSVIPLAWFFQDTIAINLSRPSLFYLSLLFFWLFTIPLLYWALCRIKRKGKAGPVSAAETG